VCPASSNVTGFSAAKKEQEIHSQKELGSPARPPVLGDSQQAHLFLQAGCSSISLRYSSGVIRALLFCVKPTACIISHYKLKTSVIELYFLIAASSVVVCTACDSLTLLAVLSVCRCDRRTYFGPVRLCLSRFSWEAGNPRHQGHCWNILLSNSGLG
jgi:hypothetical protein